MFWTRVILWRIIKVLGYLIGMVRYFPARKKFFFVPYLTRPHICRHTYCSNMAKAGMNPKMLQYLMGHSDISVTMNVYTHLGFDDAKDEMIRLEELEAAKKEVEKVTGEKPISQKMFKAI